jgi:hypothetical protein
MLVAWVVAVMAMVVVPWWSPESAARYSACSAHPRWPRPPAGSPRRCSSLVHRDDERVPRAASLAVFDALASPKKTLHANPGKHVDLPQYETDSSLRFLARHLR